MVKIPHGALDTGASLVWGTSWGVSCCAGARPGLVLILGRDERLDVTSDGAGCWEMA